MHVASFSDLWSLAVARLAALHAVFGTPFAFLSARDELTRAERSAIMRHLLPLERLVRAALLFLALCEPAPAPPSARTRSKPKRGRSAPSWPGAESSAWRGVRFRVLPAPHRAHAGARAKGSGGVFSRYPLATRIEAIARVIAAPDRWVRRLASMLRTQKNRVVAAIRRLIDTAHRAPADIAAAARLIEGVHRDTS
ncbi:MAG: hypothetical protein GC206_15955 [Alphaproteobacteria bacterium]|nr:hypothetical protein [Alphaproteobacteria bacterium]